jgi:hypothetical protein
VIELTITHDGTNWIAASDLVSAEAASLPELDRVLRDRLRSEGRLAPGAELDLMMVFDNDGIPVWMRQYAQHYFNRVVRITGR